MNSPSSVRDNFTHDLSIIIVSFNTRELLKKCLDSVVAATGSLKVETIVIDNVSRDQSAEMVEAEYPWVKLLRSDVNLGFGPANNKAYEVATGRYIVLLNSDAFLFPDSLTLSVKLMDENEQVGIGGGRLLRLDNSLQPSARLFPSLLNTFLVYSGLAERYAHSRFFGRMDNTWADPMQACETDWIPGAYLIIRRDILANMPMFDPAFFLYCEEVDLCKRTWGIGYKVMYWPQIAVTHIGGESSKSVTSLEMSRSGAQLILWSMRSTLLFYRKHYGGKAYLIYLFEIWWNSMRSLRNSLRGNAEGKAKAAYYKRVAEQMKCAWMDTNGGRVSPTQPW